MRKMMTMLVLLCLACVCARADKAQNQKLAELDRLWALEKTKKEWVAIYLKETSDWGDYAKHIGNRCPIAVMMSGTDPGLDCLINHKLCEGMSPGFYGVDMEVSIGGNNDCAGILAGKRLYKDLKPWHATERRSKHHGVTNVCSRPPVPTLWPEKYPKKKFDRVRYTLTFDKDTVRKLLTNNLYFFGISNDHVPPKMRAIMAKLMGPYYLRSRLSEGQAGYFRPLKTMSPKPKDRREALNALTEYHKGNWFPVSGSQPTLNNIMASLGKGRIARFDPEVAWDSPQILCAMHNGLARSLGIAWTAYYATESTSKWGPGKRPVIPETPYEGLFRFTYWHGDRPLDLIERSLYTYWLEGIDFILISDGAHLVFKKGPDENTFLPSDFGLKIKKLNDMAMSKNGFDRGDVYRPAALMFDKYTNWKPPTPIDAHTWDPPSPYKRKIMGLEDYKKKDYMIDNFMGAVFPGFEWMAAWGTPQDLVNTPYGDSFEVVYDSVDQEVLAYYPSCFVLGEPEMTPELKQKLIAYVRNGGDLVLNIMQVDEELLDFAGVKADWHINRWYKQLGELRVADASKSLVNGETYMEDRYHYNRVKAAFRTKVLAETAGNSEFAGDLDAGWPLITKRQRDKGNVYLVMAQYMQNASCLNFPHALLSVCKELIGHVLDPHQAVDIDGPPIQYIVNKKDNGGLIVTVINNARKTWQGRVVVRDAAKLDLVKEWYNNTVPEVATEKKNAVIATALEPAEIRIYSFEKKQ